MRGLWSQLLALFLIVLGTVLLLNALGITHISAGDFVAGVFAVLLILIGIAMLRRSRRLHKEPLRDVFLGNIQVTEPGWKVEDTTFQLGMGQIFLDLTKGELPEQGEHTLRFDGLVGQIHVVVPQGVPISATAQVSVGALWVLGQRAEGLLRSLAVASPDYASASRRLNIEANLAIGEVRIEYAAR